MNRTLALIATVLLALAGCTPGGGATPGFSLNLPASLSITQGESDTLTVTITRTGGFSGDVTLSLGGAPAGVTHSFGDNPVTGSSTTLTLEVAGSVAAGDYLLTVQGSAGSLTHSEDFTLTVTVPPIVTVTGRILVIDGSGLAGVNVQIVDADGPKAIVVSGVDGSFTVSDVRVPYSVSAVPPPPVDYQRLPTTWVNVTRPDPQIVLLGVSASPSCTRAPAQITGTLAAAVEAGHTASVLYIAEGISLQPLSSNASTSLPSGATSYSLNVPFDEILCETELNGKLIYLEYDGGGEVVKSAVYDVSAITGNVTVRNIAATSATTALLSGSVAFPDSATGGSVNAVLKVGSAHALIDTVSVTPMLPDYEIAVPILAGLEYRTLAYGWGAGLHWAYSDILAPGDVAVLELPDLSTPVAPSGPISTTTPTFTETPVGGANLYFTAFEKPGVSVWIGASTDPSITLPDLPAPARLESGESYVWYALTSLIVRGGADADTMLDGRMIKQPYFYADLSAIYNPNAISAGVINETPMPFNLP